MRKFGWGLSWGGEKSGPLWERRQSRANTFWITNFKFPEQSRLFHQVVSALWVTEL